MTTKIPVELSSTPGIVDGSNATAITIDSSENVGIGVTPSAKLHVVGSEVLFDNTGGDFTLKLNTNAVGDKNEIIMGDTSTPLAKFGVGGTADDIITGSDGQDFNIGTAGGGRAINFSTDNFASVEMKLDGGHLGLGMSPAAVGSDTVLSIYNSATPRIKLHNSTTGTASSDGGEINMSSSDLIIENREDGNQRFFTNGSERLRIQSSGGISFNGDTATANALDDYEEGNYTATITCASGSIALYSSYDTLAYTKIGRKVHVQGKLTVNSVSSPSGATTINLPFTIGDLTDRAGFCTHMGIGYFNGSAISSGFHGIYMEGSEGTAYIRPYVMKPSSTAGNAPSTNNLGDDYVAQGSDIYINFSYITT
jgi:hypothetical protein